MSFDWSTGSYSTSHSQN